MKSMAMSSQLEKQKIAANAKKYGQNPRLQRQSDSYRTAPKRIPRNKHAATEDEITNLKTANADLASKTARLESRVVELETYTRFLSSKIVQVTTERSATKKSEPESTLTRFCRMHGIQTFPEDPTEKLRGLLSEFNIEDSAVDIVRDVRDNT